MNNVASSHYALKRFQGIGKSSREAKYVCCAEAMKALEKQMPGANYFTNNS